MTRTPPIRPIGKEPARWQLCAGCEHLSAGHTCMASARSGVERPVISEARRCHAFEPIYSALDGRTGAQLWPDLAGAPSQTYPG